MEFEFHIKDGIIIIDADSPEEAQELVEQDLDAIFMDYTVIAVD